MGRPGKWPSSRPTRSSRSCLIPWLPNAIYFVRRSTGYDQFVTNGAGVVVAYPMNVRIPAAVPGYLADGSMLKLTMNPDGQLPAYTAGGATLNLQVLFNG